MFRGRSVLSIFGRGHGLTGSNHRRILLRPSHIQWLSRFLASQTSDEASTSRVSHQELQEMRSKAQFLVEEMPLGAIDGENWVSAEDQIRWWASLGTPLSVNISFLLLERLVEEQLHSETSMVSTFLDYKLLDDLVVNWHFVSKSLLASPASGLISPSRLMAEVDKLCAKSPTLDVSGKCLMKILEIVGRQSKRRASVRDAVFAESLLDRMLDMIDGLETESSTLAPFQTRAVSLNWVLSTWSACARPDRAHELLRRVQDRIQPSTVSYNCLLAAYAKVGNGLAAEHGLERNREAAHAQLSGTT